MKIQEIEMNNDKKIKVGRFTLLIGPNNVGKSQTLKDIYRRLAYGVESETVIVTKAIVDRPDTFEELLVGLDVRLDPINVGHYIIDGITSDKDSNSMLRLRLADIRRVFESNPTHDYTFQKLGKFRVFYMNSESRLSIANSCKNFVPDEDSPKTLLQAMYGQFGETDSILEDAFEATFGMKIRLDYSAGPRLRFAVSREFVEVPDDPRKAYPLMKAYPSLESQGDGFRSFVAVVLSLLLSENKVVLLDEPEAFLHPEQARRLGRWIADHVDRFSCQVLVATHNASFLSGVLSGKEPAAIFRLNRNGNNTTFCSITAEATKALSTSPILSSQRVLEGIFARGVVICEADSDRIVYSSVAVHVHDNQELLFIHAYNKQTIKDVVKILRAASIPVAAIVDIDVLNSATDFLQTLEAFNASIDYSEISKLRDRVSHYIEGCSEKEILEKIKTSVSEFLAQSDRREHNLLGAKGALNRLQSESSKWSAVKAQGIAALEDGIRSDAQNIIDQCKTLGLFVVPVGELEGWINLQVRKNRWVVPALEQIVGGKCPPSLSEFVREIAQHVYSATS